MSGADMKKGAIYPGTFDPFTNGHLDLITRGLNMFGHITVAVAENPKKKPMFDVDERVGLIKEALSGIDNVSVEPFGTLLVDFARQKDVGAVIRGLRAVSDFEFELQLALMNRKLDREVETVFMMPSLRYIFLSSTIVKEAAQYGGDVTDLVPENVALALKNRLSGGQ